jgi:hypothetical protein
MSLTEDEWALLDDVADDWYGLWEVDWWFNAAHPDWPFESRRDYLADLVGRGLIEIFFGTLGKESPPIEESAARAAISRPETWLPRTGATGDSVYHVSTSSQGQLELARSQP